MREDGVGDGGGGRVSELLRSDIEKQGIEEPSENAAAVGEPEDSAAEKIIDVVVVNCGGAGGGGGGSKSEPQIERDPTPGEECRVCQEDTEEALINLGCQCRGGLAKAHQSCIIKWFSTRGSNKCEICQEIASNITPPDPQTGYWIWRVDPALRAQERTRGCFSPLWVAFSILIGGLLLDVLISVMLGVSALPVNIIIGVIVVLGLGTALRLALEFCQEWNVRRVVQRVEANASLGYHPAL
ncbi:uncharacterized protein LOC127263322 isoform X2 [Andrographis paniculata]|uniref:uncharacterized protein LOC127263322 isoform X2 n=1 Tax=Andrographis paniculata TaxID=175694 RepID=UPI0021E7067A|nr:uncharacterized protein LOC127263322 isoform X2 [Andrographis paniculata]